MAVFAIVLDKFVKDLSKFHRFADQQLQRPQVEKFFVFKWCYQLSWRAMLKRDWAKLRLWPKG